MAPAQGPPTTTRGGAAPASIPRQQHHPQQQQQQQQQQPSASTTLTVTDLASPAASRRSGPAVLRLRGAPAQSGRSVSWADDVVDNEGMGRKKSKVCCIFHPVRDPDQSSDSSSSSSSSSSDSSDSETESDRRKRVQDRANNNNNNNNNNDGSHSHDQSCPNHRRGKPRRPRRRHDPDRPPSPNAYERMPKHKPRGPDGATSSTS